MNFTTIEYAIFIMFGFAGGIAGYNFASHFIG